MNWNRIIYWTSVIAFAIIMIVLIAWVNAQASEDYIGNGEQYECETDIECVEECYDECDDTYAARYGESEAQHDWLRECYASCHNFRMVVNE